MSQRTCWICRARPTASREHLIKASDVRSFFGRASRGDPVFYQGDGYRNRPVGSAKSKRFKSEPVLCATCDNSTSAAQPQGLGRVRIYLERGQRRQLEVRGPGSRVLAGLAPQVAGGGAAHQEATGPVYRAPGPVDQAPQHREELGGPLDLVEDDEPIRVAAQLLLRLGEAGEVARRLEIEIEGRALGRDGFREGRLADLAWAEKCHGRELVQASGEGGSGDPG